MNQFKLIKLQNKFILVNSKAEEGIHPQVTYFDNKVDLNSIYVSTEMFTENKIPKYIKGINGSRPFKYGKLDALDFIVGNKSVKVKASFWTNPNTVNGTYWSYFKYNKKFNNITKKEAVVQAINQFLIWHNENK